MKNLFKFTLAACAYASVLMFTACDKNEDEMSDAITFEVDGSVNGATVLDAYANNIVISRYENLAEKAGELYTAAQAIVAGGDDEADQIEAAANKWIEARLAWERTEAYLFGPVDLYKIDPGIDSWPLALADLSDFITSSYTEFQIQNDNGEKKGFHTIEFLLFEDGSAKSKLTDFNSSEISSSYGFSSIEGDDIQAFLVAITKELYYNTILLVAEWDSIENTSIATDAATLGVKTNNGGGYIDDFTAAGDEDESSYSTIEDALSVILESAAGIADEVGAVKIYDPYASKNVLDVESWFSWNSVYDFTDNIIGIKEAYFGTLYGGTSVEYSSSSFASASAASNSISAYVASGSSSLDATVKAAIENAISKVSALPYPFRNYLSDSSKAADIEAAMDACVELLEALETAQMAVNDGYYIE